MTWAPRGISRTYSASVGRRAKYRAPRDVATDAPSGAPINVSWANQPRSEWKAWPGRSTTRWRFPRRSSMSRTVSPARNGCASAIGRGYSTNHRGPASGLADQGLAERVEAGDVAPDDQRVDIVRPFVGADGLEVQEVADDRVLVDDPGRPEDVPRHPRGLERHRDVVHLRHRHLLGAHARPVLEAAELEAEELGLGDLGHHPDELPLDELEAPDGSLELHARLGVLERPVVARHRGTHRAPGNAVPGLGETGERPLEPRHPGEPVLDGDPAILEREL